MMLQSAVDLLGAGLNDPSILFIKSLIFASGIICPKNVLIHRMMFLPTACIALQLVSYC
jgi:hypothetical protein